MDNPIHYLDLSVSDQVIAFLQFRRYMHETYASVGLNYAHHQKDLLSEFHQYLYEESKKPKSRKSRSNHWRAITLSPPKTDDPSIVVKYTEKLAHNPNTEKYLYVYEFRSDGTLHSHILIKYYGYPSDIERTCKSFQKKCKGNFACFKIDPDPHVQACESKYFFKQSLGDKEKLNALGLEEFYSNYYNKECPGVLDMEVPDLLSDPTPEDGLCEKEPDMDSTN